MIGKNKRMFKKEIAGLIERLKAADLSYEDRQLLEDEVIRLGRLEKKLSHS